MLCPSCGAEVAVLKFCENCGNPLNVGQGQAQPAGQLPVQPTEAYGQSVGAYAQQTHPIERSTDASAQPTEAHAQPTEEYVRPAATSAQPTEAYAQQTYPIGQPADAYVQPTESVPTVYAPEVPGDSAWQAKPQQAYQVGQTMQMPAQAGAGGYVPPSGGPQMPYQQPSSYQPPSGSQAPNAAFVLVIVGLVLSVLFVTFLPGIVCSIVGLALNAGYNKKGLDNPRKTPTLVIGIIGIVIAAMCLAFTVVVGVTTGQVLEQLDEQGIDITTDSVEVTTDSSGHINITVADSSSASADSGASAASSQGSAAGGAAPGDAASSSSASAASSGSAASAASPASPSLERYEENIYHDAEWNPSLYSVLELTGAEMSDLLDYYGFDWDDEIKAWTASDGSLYAVSAASGALSKADIVALPKGAAGQADIIVLAAGGYASAEEAFSGLTSDIVVEDEYVDDGTVFGVVYGPSMVRYLVVATPNDADVQSVLLFTDESISSGLFAELLGFDAGSSIKEAWNAIVS